MLCEMHMQQLMTVLLECDVISYFMFPWIFFITISWLSVPLICGDDLSDECLWPDSIILSQYVGKKLKHTL